MDWLGIGVFILSLAFAGLVIILIPVMKKLAATLDNTASTVETVNKSIGDVTGEATVLLYNTNETLVDVNGKISKLNPLFDILHDTGESAHHLTSTLARYTAGKAERGHAGAEFVDRKNLEGILRGAAFIYYLREFKKEYDKK
ncbi:DUF948 domain-containing protein [Salipaludibacillus sp. CUR1]|uniref:DUF948 domain-containing protein n=1 Tax=Salipaludibacillus sp. CUR1 TaxID=2820003 RepID=UPI001E5E8F50|nr:DUF948 domain-containing protein [Salipaludibacillus sp. CUR1]MCE7792534.1 DUF948 domain-containing protein [Salipaludibacillus sp. CUR1]